MISLTPHSQPNACAWMMPAIAVITSDSETGSLQSSASGSFLESAEGFPFQAKCLATKVVSPRRKGETVEVVRMAPDEVCEHDMLVLVRWQGRTMAAPLAQLTTVDLDESTAEAVGDWHYWVAQGYCL